MTDDEAEEQWKKRDADMRFLALHEDQIRRGRIPGSHRRHLLAGIKADRERLEAAIKANTEDQIEQARRGVGSAPSKDWCIQMARREVVDSSDAEAGVGPGPQWEFDPLAPLGKRFHPARDPRNTITPADVYRAQGLALHRIPAGCDQQGRFETRPIMKKPTPIPPTPIPCRPDRWGRFADALGKIGRSPWFIAGPVIAIAVIVIVGLVGAAYSIANQPAVSSGFRTDGGSK
jgi:hypothetical protein